MSHDSQPGADSAGTACDETPVRLPVERIAMVARWKPVHLGHAAVLRGLSDAAQHALIGIGSSNRHDADNPFSAAETQDMIRRVLAGRDNYSLFEVPDLGNGPKWRLLVRDLIEEQLATRGGRLGAFVTANDYVRDLMQGIYPVVHPIVIVAPRDRTRLTGTAVRKAMLQGGDDWRRLVPRCVADYLDEHNLVERFRREFPANRPVDATGLAPSDAR